jgi:hypothetical protein
MMTGDSYNLPIQIETNMGFANMGTFEDMEVMFGDVLKTISKGEIKYDNEKQAFLIPLSQQETFRQKRNIEVQIRFKFPDGSVIGISAGNYNIEKSTSKVVL